MPIRNCGIKGVDKEDRTNIALPIRLSNPNNGKSVRLYGIIDTGASDCFVPARLGTLLGCKIKYTKGTETLTGKGTAKSYKHKMNIVVYHPDDPEKVIFETLENIEVHLLDDLPEVLLGVNGFLSKFTLIVDYPKKQFSLIY